MAGAVHLHGGAESWCVYIKSCVMKKTTFCYIIDVNHIHKITESYSLRYIYLTAIVTTVVGCNRVLLFRFCMLLCAFWGISAHILPESLDCLVCLLHYVSEASILFTSKHPKRPVHLIRCSTSVPFSGTCACCLLDSFNLMPSSSSSTFQREIMCFFFLFFLPDQMKLLHATDIICS